MSPVRDFDECVGRHAEAIRSALSDVASSSRESRRESWTSSDDEADCTDYDNNHNEGQHFFLKLFSS